MCPGTSSFDYNGKLFSLSRLRRLGTLVFHAERVSGLWVEGGFTVAKVAEVVEVDADALLAQIVQQFKTPFLHGRG